MATLATLVVKLIGDTADFSSKMGEAQNLASKLGGGLTKVGKAATIGLTAPLVAAGVAAINYASDQQEALNKVNVVFDEHSNKIKTFASDSATAMGMTKTTTFEAVGTFGNLFDAMGVAEDAGYEMSTSLVQLAADLASFNNIDPTVALEKLRSGIVGETEPMRQLGVDVSATAVEIKALEMGLADTGKELTQQDKIMARYALIMEQTANAQGDFARTSDGLANSQRILKAQVGDFAAELGTHLLPYAQELVGWLRQLFDRFLALSPATQKNILIAAGLAAALGPVLIIVGSLVSAIGAIIPVIGAVVGVLSGPILLVIAVIIGVIALLRAAWVNNWGDIQGKTQMVIAFIQTTIQNFLAAVQAWWAAHGAQVIATVQAIWAWIQNTIQSALAVLRSIIKTVVGWISAFWSAHGAAMMAATRLAWDNVKAIIQGVVKIIQSLIKAFSAALRGDWYAVGQFLREAWDAAWKMVITVLRNAYTAIKGIVSSLIEGIKTWFKSVNWGEVGKAIVNGIANGIKNGASAIINAAKAAAKAALEAAKGFLGIKSPSTAFMKLGFQSAEGYALGLANTGSIEKAAQKLSLAATQVRPLGSTGGDTYNSTQYNVTGTFREEREESIVEKLRLLAALTT